jgi:hypothetical protein
VRCPAGLVSLTSHSGGAGAPPGSITRPCQELADSWMWRFGVTSSGSAARSPINTAVLRLRVSRTLSAMARRKGARAIPFRSRDRNLALQGAPFPLPRERNLGEKFPHAFRRKESPALRRSAAAISHVERERALRFGADRICLRCLCGDRGCKRAKACRGDVRRCAGPAERWLAAIVAEKRARPDFAAMESQIETPEELKAYRAWRKALE